MNKIRLYMGNIKCCDFIEELNEKRLQFVVTFCNEMKRIDCDETMKVMCHTGKINHRVVKLLFSDALVKESYIELGDDLEDSVIFIEVL